MNIGQVRAFVPLLSTAGNERLCFVFTSSEYFTASAWMCVDGDITMRLYVTDNEMHIPSSAAEGLGALLNKTYYGSIWNAWVYLET